ncbi:MAG TPA: site-specific integrase [Candidatus Pelethenecus faecipullorum]|uniref:Site-specific integrase n=1 Tax=Candidatus Pelethenecus faecipullorum TaxID=2840900 RepID=A0A9D1GR06_9MOLU|nr:site-specific integrase [Candidatus Pelethenecus faecipullorum]
MKYKNWLKVWLENYVKPVSKQRTYIRYQQVVLNHILPNLGDMEMNGVTPVLLQQFLTKLLQTGNRKTGQGLSVNSVHIVVTILQNSFQMAYELGFVDKEVARKLKRPKTQEKKIICFTIQEQKRIEEEIIKNKKIKMYGILLCLYTGLRIGELLALEWSDINFRTKEISVTKTCFDGKDKNDRFCRITGTPKTITSIRTIPIPKSLLPMLKMLKSMAKNQYVISDSEKVLSVRSYQRSFERLLKKIRIEKKGFHALRHTFATRALEIGMDVKTLSEILGHKNANVTLQRYAHSMPEHKKDMMNKIGKLL